MKILAGVALLAAIAGGAWFCFRKGSEAAQYRFAAVEKGDLVVTVTATGTVQPVNTVQVGTQVSGTIKELFADFNSKVEKNKVIAQIDPAPFEARVAQDRASVAKSVADVERVKASLEQAEKELARSQELLAKNLLSQSDLDTAIANKKSLDAQLAVTKATVDQGKATLQASELSLQYTTIRSTMDGIVISRNVDVGQTVAASLSAPTLFVIADNLKRIQVQASVSEADIGKIENDQKASFTVDAFRDRNFHGTVSQVRLAPTTVQNVVTYTVVIHAENPGEKLLPGMTATVTFEVERHEDVLKVPNAALRYTPPSETAATTTPTAPTTPAPAQPSPVPNGERHGGHGGRGKTESRVWILGASGPTAVTVVAGSTDGISTQIVKGDLKEGQQVIVGALQETPDPPMTNPFGGGRRGR